VRVSFEAQPKPSPPDLFRGSRASSTHFSLEPWIAGTSPAMTMVPQLVPNPLSPCLRSMVERKLCFEVGTVFQMVVRAKGGECIDKANRWPVMHNAWAFVSSSRIRASAGRFDFSSKSQIAKRPRAVLDDAWYRKPTCRSPGWGR